MRKSFLLLAAAAFTFCLSAADGSAAKKTLKIGEDGLPIIELPDIQPVQIKLLPKDPVGAPKVEPIKPEVIAAQPVVVKPPVINNFTTSMNEMIAQYKSQLKLIKDQRNLAYDRSFDRRPELWNQWKAIYEEKLDEITAAPKLVPWRLRMIAEAQLPRNQKEREILERHLAYYKGKGFTSVLLTFNCTENLQQLLDLQSKIHEFGFTSWIAYSNIDDLNFSVFENPDTLKRYFSALGASAEGMLLGWRRTSAHLFLMDEHYAQFIYKAASMSNSKLKVLGESYVGETAEFAANQAKLTVNNPSWVSGTALAGVGFSQVNAKGAIDGVFAPVKSLQRVAIIIGDQPYYLSTNKNSLDFEQNFKCKARIEQEFRAAGCIGTIVCHGDSGVIGSGSSREITDSLYRVN